MKIDRISLPRHLPGNGLDNPNPVTLCSSLMANTDHEIQATAQTRVGIVKERDQNAEVSSISSTLTQIFVPSIAAALLVIVCDLS